MLAQSREAHYIHEPFAPMYERSWLIEPPLHRYYYEPPEQSGRFADDLERIVSLRPHWRAIARRAGGLRNAARIVEEASLTAVARRRKARALIKDPFALLLAEWIYSRTGADIIVLVRHPAAFAGSVKRLGWRLDVRWLLDQPRLMSAYLDPLRAELEADRDGRNDLIGHAILVWRALNIVVEDYETRHPGWHVVRYEDLAADPVTQFRGVYNKVGLSWSSHVARHIERRNSATHGADVPPGARGGTTRDSRLATRTWMTRLTHEEIERVRVGTHDVASRWYDDAAWQIAK